MFIERELETVSGCDRKRGRVAAKADARRQRDGDRTCVEIPFRLHVYLLVGLRT